MKPFFAGRHAVGGDPPIRRSVDAFGFALAHAVVRPGTPLGNAPTAARPNAAWAGARPDPRDRFRPAECARIAVYDEPGSAPRVEEIEPAATGEYISALASRTYELSRGLGGRMPYSVIVEVVENYIHAAFRSPVITILDFGNTIRFSDQGPGIKDKRKAVEPGYTTASADMKRYIRGVGSGLPLVTECLSFKQGDVCIEDNIGSGTVVTVSVSGSERSPEDTAAESGAESGQGVGRSSARPTAHTPRSGDRQFAATPRPTGGPDILDDHSPIFSLEASSYPVASGASRLTNRQKRVLALVMDAGEAGPSLVAHELAIGLSTAYRDLAHLEALGFIISDESGKRSITAHGSGFLRSLLHPGR